MRAIDADALIEQQFKNDISYKAFVNLVKRQPTIESKLLKQLKILATVLDGCPLTEACDKLFDLDYEWCRQHCKPGQDAADAECWMKYAEVMTDV